MQKCKKVALKKAKNKETFRLRAEDFRRDWTPVVKMAPNRQQMVSSLLTQAIRLLSNNTNQEPENREPSSQSTPRE